MPQSYDAVLVLSFGGPEQHDDVIPFLENVTRGRNIPRERLLEVAEHYYHFDGRSPINDQNRALIGALTAELQQHGLALPVYWGNRNWRPYLADTLRQMASDGVNAALVFVTSAFGSYSGCRQYLEDMARARAELGETSPQLHKLPNFHDHPGFIESVADRIRQALAQVAPDADPVLIFTAHSIPTSMADTSPYVSQLKQACQLVARELNRSNWQLAYQSRSGPPSQPWLEPDIADALRRIRTESGPGTTVVISPIGFVSDHMEVVYDLDTEAQQLAAELDLRLIRAGTPGIHPRFVAMIRELIEAALIEAPSPCAQDCCPPPARPPSTRLAR